MKWIAVETHTHTVHSDAQMTVEELLTSARAAQLDAIVISDHNTDTALMEVPVNQVNPMVIPGIEWTTFYGHVVIIGLDHFVEFRDLTAKNLDEHLKKIHKAGAVAVMAHPCCPGEPFCCGCHWDFEIPDWKEIDALEVWSEDNPSLNPYNNCAYKLWNKKISEGYMPTALTARDWHQNFAPEIPFGVNYMFIEEEIPLTDALKDAIRQGRTYFTLGPTVDFSVSDEKETVQIGGRVSSGVSTIRISFDNLSRKSVWEPYELMPEKIILYVNGDRREYPFSFYKKELLLKEKLSPGWIRLELTGTIHGEPGALLMTNPIYIGEK